MRVRPWASHTRQRLHCLVDAPMQAAQIRARDDVQDVWRGDNHRHNDVTSPQRNYVSDWPALQFLQMTAATPSSSTAASSSSSSDHRSPQLSASAPASSSATPQVGTATDVQPNRCAGLIDILLFNPPYVPTPDEEVYAPAGLVTEGGRTPGTSTATATAGAGADRASQSQPTADPLVAAWAGGERGRRVIDRALPQIAAALSRPSPAGASSTGAESSDTPEAINSGCGGVVYMVLVDDNEPADVAAMSRKLGLASKIIARTQARNESLMIMRLQWADGAT